MTDDLQLEWNVVGEQDSQGLRLYEERKSGREPLLELVVWDYDGRAMLTADIAKQIGMFLMEWSAKVEIERTAWKPCPTWDNGCHCSPVFDCQRAPKVW